jgi:hypothetical protein
MRNYDCLDFAIVGIVAAIVHLLFGASVHEAAAYAFRLIGVCACLRAALDVVEWIRS